MLYVFLLICSAENSLVYTCTCMLFLKLLAVRLLTGGISDGLGEDMYEANRTNDEMPRAFEPDDDLVSK